MPIYEYKCQSCEAEHEVFVRGKTEPESCPECQGPLARKISRAGIIFKGSGFYVNDSRGSGDKKSSSNGSVKSSNGAGESKSESKSVTTDSGSSKTESTSKSSS
jgi:putative FmdB family regulatory protein